MTVAELGRELGVDVRDLEVMIAALGERVDDELSAVQAADLLDVLDAKIRLRNGAGSGAASGCHLGNL